MFVNLETMSVEFKVIVPKNSYFGIGFGTSMTYTDMIAFKAYNDHGVADDLWSTGHTKP